MPTLFDGTEKTNNTAPANNTGAKEPFFKPAIQREEDKAQPQQAPAKGWTTNLVSIIVYDDSHHGNCFGAADESGVSTLSSCMHWPSCREFNIPLRVEFYIDRMDKPHPQPISVSASIYISFTPNGGQEKVLFNSTDARPVYKGPNEILGTSFGKTFPVSIDTDGKLNIRATLHDDALGQDIVYTDSKSFVILCS